MIVKIEVNLFEMTPVVLLFDNHHTFIANGHRNFLEEGTINGTRYMLFLQTSSYGSVLPRPASIVQNYSTQPVLLFEEVVVVLIVKIGMNSICGNSPNLLVGGTGILFARENLHYSIISIDLY